jgi:hypothetical protein
VEIIYRAGIFTWEKKQIVQTGGFDWGNNRAHSVFIINMEQKGKDVVPDMVHRFITDKGTSGIKKGRIGYCWEPWKQYLAGKVISKQVMSNFMKSLLPVQPA